jgi:hypothetical protein
MTYTLKNACTQLLDWDSAQRVVRVSLQKRAVAEGIVVWWKRAFKAAPEIDVTKIEGRDMQTQRSVIYSSLTRSTLGSMVERLTFVCAAVSRARGEKPRNSSRRSVQSESLSTSTLSDEHTLNMGILKSKEHPQGARAVRVLTRTGSTWKPDPVFHCVQLGLLAGE